MQTYAKPLLAHKGTEGVVRCEEAGFIESNEMVIDSKKETQSEEPVGRHHSDLNFALADSSIVQFRFIQAECVIEENWIRFG